MGRKLLLVEGKDDKHVLMHICGNRTSLKLDKIKDHEGVDDLIDNLTEELRAAVNEGDIVGVIVDADVDLEGRWRKLRTKIARAGYPEVPERPTVNGTIIDPPPNTLLPRMGVWVMPNNQTSGNLEHFLEFLIPSPHPLYDHAQSSVASIPCGFRRFKTKDHRKALIHTWLAWQKEPGKPYGTAITARFLDPDVTEVDTLVSWLRRLFNV